MSHTIHIFYRSILIGLMLGLFGKKVERFPVSISLRQEIIIIKKKDQKHEINPGGVQMNNTLIFFFRGRTTCSFNFMLLHPSILNNFISR